MNNIKTYEEYLEEHGSLTYIFSGVSMNPMLKEGRDLFTVEKKTGERCKKYDVVLYLRPPHQYVLHRIVKVCEEDYVILGDNCATKEYGIKDENILGVMTEFLRAGKRISVNNKWYQFYVRFWYGIYPLRMMWKKWKGIWNR